jgi:hypothetical protein
VATPNDVPAIERFNARLAAGGHHRGLPRPRADSTGEHGRETVYLALDRGGEIRAGVRLVHERFFIRDEERWGAWLQAPISEGIVDPRYAFAALQLGRHVSTEHPLLLGLGIGGLDQPAARFLIAAGSEHAPVPFFFLPVRPRRIARELRLPRARRWMSLAARAAATTGLPQLALSAHRLGARRGRRDGAVSADDPDRFGHWATETYRGARQAIGAGACRDAETLNQRYPVSDDRFLRLRLRAATSPADVGWAVVAPMQMHEHAYFGDLRVGVVVDAFGAPGREAAVMSAAVDALVDHEVDLVVANWSNTRWREAARASGFLGGPTNYFFFAPPTAAPLLADVPIGDMHLTRGDSDGMVHLKGTPLA